jgi:signal transduction histidine kinase
MGIKEFLHKLKSETGADSFPRTFGEELNRLCNVIIIPTSFLTMLSWPIFIAVDKELFGDISIIIYLRWGLTLVGFISLVLLLTPRFRNRGYWLILFIIYYVGAATAIIMGLVGGHPSYMGGFAIVILTCSLAPIQRIHALLHLFTTLFLFTVVSLSWKVKFALSEESYGLYNVVVSVGIALLGIFIFDRIRKDSYRKGLLLKIANEDLQKADELKNQLLQLAAHGLKDPLQVIIGYTDMLQMKLKDDKFAAERLKIIYRSTDRMIKLIAGFLEITSIESGKLVMHKTDVDLGEVVEAAVKNHEKNSGKKNQTLHAAINKGCIIYGDKMLMRQVANHLIDNAVKFSPPGKSIWVAVAPHDESVAFKVRDEGPGLREDELKKLFEKFQSLTPRPTGGEISTGLGLAITKDLVELHDGTICVESEPDKGSTFTVTFPLYRENPGLKNR